LESLRNWVVRNANPVVIDFTEKAGEKIFGQHVLPGVLLFVDGGEDSEVAAAAFRKAAEKLAGQAFFAKVDIGDSKANRIIEFVGVKKSDVPTIRAVAVPEGGGMPAKYRFDDDVTFENIVSFLQDYNAKNLRTYMKSEDPPAKNDLAVKTVVATTFKKIVLDPSKDVLIEFYAPWCGHCQKMAPELEKAAARLATIPNVVIATMDATANEVDGINVNSYPTFKWYPAFKKHAPQEVTDIHNEEAVVQWVKKNASNKKFQGEEL